MNTDNSDKDYSLRQDRAWDRFMETRKATREAAFLLPFLNSGMSLVDVGCGQGTITVDLAEILAPGRVVGFDPQEEQIDGARRLARQRGLTNVTFEIGDVYEPPVEPEAFDVAFSHMVFIHLPDPEKALESVKHIIKPGGLIATRERGAHTHFGGSDVDAAERAARIIRATAEAASGSPYGTRVGEVMNRLCRLAGLEVIAHTASMDVTSDVSLYAGTLRGPFGQRVVASGMSTESDLKELATELDKWEADPDAFIARDAYEVVARKP
jgi:ubiquinone/menaquinone biosynthesis C-methylase UbiE